MEIRVFQVEFTDVGPLVIPRKNKNKIFRDIDKKLYNKNSVFIAAFFKIVSF